MPQANTQGQGSAQGGFRTPPLQAPMLALRGIGQVYDMNLAATRVLLRTQARAASAFGWTGLTAVLEQLSENAQRANEAAADLQRQVGRVVETQASSVAESLQHGLEELGTQTTEGLKQLCETARQQADEAERTAQAITEELRDTLREGREQMGETMREGGERMRAAMRQNGDEGREQMHDGGQQARDAARESGEETREAGRQAGEHARQSGKENREAAQRGRKSASH